MQPRQPCPPLARLFFIVSCSLIFLALDFAVRAQTSASTDATLDDAIRQLADRIASIPGLHGPLRLEFIQNSAFLGDNTPEWKATLRNELERHHLAVTKDMGAALLRVAFTETPTQLVFAAGVHTGDNDEVRLVTLPRLSFRTASLPVVPVRIEKQLVYESPSRILDASSLWNGAESGLVLLSYQGAELSVERLDGAGVLRQSVSLAAAAVRPARDLRAELTLGTEDSVVTLPGKSCQFTWDSSAEPKCHATKPAWRGVTVLTPKCDAGSWKLQTDGNDWTTSDLLQVTPADSLRKGSTGMFSDFPGPILSMNAEQNPASALVVTRNLRTGNYEVHRITLVCGT